MTLSLLRKRGLTTLKPGPSGGVSVADVPPGARLNVLDLWFQRMAVSRLEVFKSWMLPDTLCYEIALERAAREEVRDVEQAVRETDDAPRRVRRQSAGAEPGVPTAI